MAQNFRLSVFKRQSYDLTQYSDPLSAAPVVGNSHETTHPNQEAPTNQSATNAGAADRRESVQKWLLNGSPPEKKNKQQDYWLCIGLMIVVTLLCLALIFIFMFAITEETPEQFVNNTTVNYDGIASQNSTNHSNTESDYNFPEELPPAPKSNLGGFDDVIGADDE